MGETPTPCTTYTNPTPRGRIARRTLAELGEPHETGQLVHGESVNAPARLAIAPLAAAFA